MTFAPPHVAGECLFLRREDSSSTQDQLIRWSHPRACLPFPDLVRLNRLIRSRSGFQLAGSHPTLSRSWLTRNRLDGVYLPFWTYDAHTTSHYTGQRGEYYYVTETYTDRDAQGKTRLQRHDRFVGRDGIQPRASCRAGWTTFWFRRPNQLSRAAAPLHSNHGILHRSGRMNRHFYQDSRLSVTRWTFLKVLKKRKASYRRSIQQDVQRRYRRRRAENRHQSRLHTPPLPSSTSCCPYIIGAYRFRPKGLPGNGKCENG